MTRPPIPHRARSLTVLLWLVGPLLLVPNAIAAPLVSPDGTLQLAVTIEALNDAAIFTFAIVSDHKGLAPASSRIMKNCVDQIAQLDARFVVGLGDHLKGGRNNPFLNFIKTDPFWFRRFYPNIADGENDYYGKGQGDWGSGGKLLDHLEMTDWPEVRIRENGCEFYARIPVENRIVHLIQLHYPDTPLDAAKAFPEDSRAYLVETLAAIDKKPGRDIIILAAHTGDWLRVLSDAHRQAVLDKADLVLGATTHYFTRYSHGRTGPLVLNTGSVGYARRLPKKLTLGAAPKSYNGFLSVHVLPDPLTLIVQYQNAEISSRRLQPVSHPFGYLKIIDGPIHPLRFRDSHGPTSAPAR